MKNVSFIIKRILILVCIVAFFGLLPFQNHILPGYTVAAWASETKTEEVKNSKLSDTRLTYTTMKLVVETSRTLSVRNLNRDAGEYAVFKASDPDIITITTDSDSKAVIFADNVGETSIIVTIKDAKKKTLQTLKCNVTVGPPAQSVKFTESEITLSLSDEGVSATLKAVVKPGNTEEKPKVTVSKEGVVCVADEANVNNGIATVTVRAAEVGTVTLTITVENGITDVCTIEVVE